VFALLRSRNLAVESLINLDTGGQDVFYVYDDRGQNIRDAQGNPLRGRQTTQRTTSLLLYTHGAGR